jgi:hypothetical protein
MLRSLKGTLYSQVAGSLGLARWVTGGILALALVQNIIYTHGRVVWCVDALLQQKITPIRSYLY